MPAATLKAIHRTDNGIQTLATYEQDARGRLTEADARLDYHLFYEYHAVTGLSAGPITTRRGARERSCNAGFLY